MRRLLALCSSAVVSFAAVQTATSAVFAVTTAADSGPGSLRTAIDSANANGGPDEIRFSIGSTPGAVRTIDLLSALPAITEAVTIDGYTQPGSQPNNQLVGNSAVLLIELRGNNAPSGATGLVAMAGPTRIKGLVIGGFKNAAISLQNAGFNIVEGCFIGTDVTGSALNSNGSGIRLFNSTGNVIGGTEVAARNVIVGGLNPAIFEEDAAGNGNGVFGNYIGVNAAGTQALGTGGVLFRSAGNVIGDITPAKRNVISCVGRYGVELSGAAAGFNIVAGNYIGLTADGTSPLTQDASGIYIGDASNNVVGGSDSSDGSVDGVVASRNVIVAKGGGVVVAGGVGIASNNIIRGNFIGTRASGTLPGATEWNSGSAIVLLNATNNIIGGDAPGAGNVLANYQFGLTIFGDRPSSGGNIVQGNFIGTNAANDPLLGHAQSGILIAAPSTNNVIGGSTPERRNVIGRSQIGITIASDDNFIQGNTIGGSVPNFGSGIVISGSGNTIGGDMGQGNLIARNGEDGITVQSSGRRNAILGNSIYENGTTRGAVGIDLSASDSSSGDGLTPNDAGDADNGGNDLQNHPVLTSVRVAGGSVTIEGRLNSKPASTYRIEFFTTIDRPRFSQGERFLGSTNVTTDAGGNATFVVTLPAPPLTEVVSATATDSAGNTSEFGGLPDRLLNISTRLPVRTGENALIGGFIVTGTENKRVLLRAIGPSLSTLFGTAALQDPTLELFQGETLLTANDNWRDTQRPEIEATGIPPSEDAESAIVRDLAPGAYTAVVRGKDNTTGIGLVEAYEIGRGVDARLANISTRGFVQTDANVLIGGFIIGGESERGSRVIVRAIGPSLTAAGVSNALQDPTLDLVDSSGTPVATNNNWRDTQEAEIQATGIPPSDNNESAIVANLMPGEYTAVVRGNGETTGVGLVEVYKLD